MPTIKMSAKGGPDFIFYLPGGRLSPLPPVNYATAANSMIEQIPKLWIFHICLLIIAQFFFDRYTTTVPVWSFWLESKNVVEGNVFLTFTTVVLNHFPEGSQIHTFDSFREPRKNILPQVNYTFCFIALTKSTTQDIRGVTARHRLSKGILSQRRIRH